MYWMRRAALVAAMHTLLPCVASFQRPLSLSRPLTMFPTMPFMVTRGLRRNIVRVLSTTCDSGAQSTDKRLLRGVMQEALEGHRRKKIALEEQLAKAAVPQMLQHFGDNQDEEAESKASKLRAKALRRAKQVPQLLAEVTAVETKLEGLLSHLALRDADLCLVRSELEDLGMAERLETFDVDKVALNQWGRPDGFHGLVVESPRGVPILMGHRSFSDPLLRRIGRGNDLWFQVCKGQGSRVLLRTSMVRHLARSSRECMEMAADLAAYFSDSRPRQRSLQDDVEVEVMFTDSRHVAKRGTRVGQMKDSKKLGKILAMPVRVAEVARQAQEEQGWL